MPFTPKFVDLVRSYTVTQGTGDLILGQAVDGFTGFAAALQPGDQFYYSAISLDRPSEREVGRGTMQANGRIVRDPIGGAPTDFSKGTKTVALIAAAEWFDKVEAAASGGSGPVTPLRVESRLALSALPAGGLAVLAEGGRSGLFLFEASDLASRIASDPLQAIHVAPLADPSGASGAWVRQFDGPLNVMWFGAAADFVSDDLPAFDAAHDYIKASGVRGGGNELRIPAGQYYLSGSWNLHTAIQVRGPGAAMGDSHGAILRFSKNCNGIVVNHGTTHGDGLGSQGSASGAIIEGLELWGGNVEVDEAGSVVSWAAGDSLTGCGIRIRTTFVCVRDVQTSFFGEDGFNMVGTAGSGGATEGLPDSFVLDRCHAIYNGRYGFFTNGDNANAGKVTACSAVSNGGCGFYETGFLGNSYDACHARDNGYENPVIPGGPTGVCTYQGQTYFCTADIGRHGEASSATPGSDLTVWKSAAGTPYPILGAKPWVAGEAWYAPGAYATNPANVNAANVFTGCYAESGQAPIQGSYPTLFVGGLVNAVGFDHVAPHSIGVMGGGAGHIAVNALKTYAPHNLSTQTSIGTDDGTTILRHQYDVGVANVRIHRSDNWGGFGSKALAEQLDNSFDARVTGLQQSFVYGGLGGTAIAKLYAGDGSVNNARAIRPFSSLSDLDGLTMRGGDLFWHMNAAQGADCLFMCSTPGTYGSGAGLTVLAKLGGGGGISNGDKGDIVVSDGGATFTVERASPSDGEFNVAGHIAASGWVQFKTANSWGLFRDRGGSVELSAFNAAGNAQVPFELVGSRLDFLLAAGSAPKATVDGSGLNLAGGGVYKIGGVAVMGAQGAAVADATGGTTVDSEARAAINALLARVRAHGLIAT